MSIFENNCIGDDDDYSDMIANAVAAYTLKHGRRDFLSNLRDLLPFFDERVLEKPFIISKSNVGKAVCNEDLIKKIGEMEWNGSPEWDRDFFQGFFDATSTLFRTEKLLRAEISKKPRFCEFLKSDIHGQKIWLTQHTLPYLLRTKSLYFMEIKPQENLEKYIRGVFSGGRPVHRGDDLWVSVRGSVRPVMDRLGIIYREGNRNAIWVSPFYIRLFNDEMPEPIAEFWREKLQKTNYRNATVDAWMHWEIMFGRKERRFLQSFPYMKSPQGCNRIGIQLDEIRQKMREHRFDHVDSRISSRLEDWLKKEKEKCNERQGN